MVDVHVAAGGRRRRGVVGCHQEVVLTNLEVWTEAWMRARRNTLSEEASEIAA
jgi:hypothetical protein